MELQVLRELKFFLNNSGVIYSCMRGAEAFVLISTRSSFPVVKYCQLIQLQWFSNEVENLSYCFVRCFCFVLRVFVEIVSKEQFPSRAKCFPSAEACLWQQAFLRKFLFDAHFSWSAANKSVTGLLQGISKIIMSVP